MPYAMPPSFRPSLLGAALISAALLPGPAAHAEKADRSKPMSVEADDNKSATVDLKSKTTVIRGNVVITQGTMRITADRVDLRETSQGRYQALAHGSSDTHATFRQKRDKVDEVVEADAERIDYDGAAEKVRFIGNAKMRIVRPVGPPDEANAAVITYDQSTDTIVFEGSSAAASGPANGRARLVFIPRQADASASGASEPSK